MKFFKHITLLTLLFNSSLFAYKTVEIDLTKQRIYAKEDGVTLFSGAISSGNRQHRTPSGTFYILNKDRYHYSNKYPEPYGGASMPYMLRLTHGGIAIHQGYLPGYPASHGCIRVSHRTAKRLWRWTSVGTEVIVYNSVVVPKRRVITYSRPYKRYTYKKQRRIKQRRNRLYRKNYSLALNRIIFK